MNAQIFPPPQQHVSGLTLIELMLAMALFTSNKNSYLAIDDDIRLQENGDFALEIIARTLRQAGYIPWENWSDKKNAIATLPPAISGKDNRQFGPRNTALAPSGKGINGSDMFIIGHFGSGYPIADKTITNCARANIAEPDNIAELNDIATLQEHHYRGWSIFYVALDQTNKPELRCRHRSSDNWHTSTIVRGVESFQILYGIDTDNDGLPNQLMRAEHRQHTNPHTTTYDLFDRHYSTLHANDDIGTQYIEKQGSTHRHRLFQTTIWIRNPAHR